MNQTIDWNTFAQRAEIIFFSPKPCYPWNAIMQGVQVASLNGGNRRLTAVAGNTFRGLHRCDKSINNNTVFNGYFVSERERLLAELGKVATREDYDNLSDRITLEIKTRFGHVKPTMLESYNRLRKLVDLALEHVIAMATETADLRSRLIPLLFLPLDSQTLQHPELLNQDQVYRVCRGYPNSFGDIKSRAVYDALQRLAQKRAEELAEQLGRPFHPIYFDLLWNDRYRNRGGNLFELNPPRAG